MTKRPPEVGERHPDVLCSALTSWTYPCFMEASLSQSKDQNLNFVRIPLDVNKDKADR